MRRSLSRAAFYLPSMFTGTCSAKIASDVANGKYSLPNARRVGSACCHVDCVAAQSRGLAEQVPAHSVGVLRDRALAVERRGCAHPCERRGGGEACDRAAAAAGRESCAAALSSVAHGSRVAAGLGTDLREGFARKDRDYELAVQCVGQV